jgi:hypothetical protein
VPNLLTSIPETPVPPLEGLAAAVLPIADAFMIAMFSRPASGSLRTTWVTPSTFWMAIGTCIGALVIAGLLLSGVIGGITSISLVGCGICVLFAIGSGAVAIVGAGQRRAQVTA